MPKVTVIMPNYNSKYIAESIRSVLEQSYADIELIVVDDGSETSLSSIAKTLAKTDSRMTIIENKENMGPAYSKNRGLSAATGEFVTFVDSDDVIRPKRLEKMLLALNSAERSIAYTDLFFMDWRGLVLEESLVDAGRHLPPAGDAYSFLLTKDVWGLVTFMSRISTIRKVGFFNESLKWGEDFDLVLRLAKENKVVFIPEPLYGYRMHGQSTTSLTPLTSQARPYIWILESNLSQSWDNLDETTRFRAVQRIRRTARESGLFSKYVAWTVNPSFVRMAAPRIMKRFGFG